MVLGILLYAIFGMLDTLIAPAQRNAAELAHLLRDVTAQSVRVASMASAPLAPSAGV